MSFAYILVPLAATLIAQISKFFIKKNRLKFSWRNLIAYSGMPSSHAAVTVSLATIIGLKMGFDSAGFAIAGLLCFLTLRDAMGIRQYIGKQGKVLNEMIEDLNEDRYLDDRYPQLLEKVGHTPAQILVGSVIGLIVGGIGFLLS